MNKWAGWIAAVGGLIAILGQYVGYTMGGLWLGGIVAIVFGAWAAMDAK